MAEAEAETVTTVLPVQQLLSMASADLAGLVQVLAAPAAVPVVLPPRAAQVVMVPVVAVGAGVVVTPLTFSTAELVPAPTKQVGVVAGVLAVVLHAVLQVVVGVVVVVATVQVPLARAPMLLLAQVLKAVS